MNIREIEDRALDGLCKTIPAGERVTPATVAAKNWNLLDDDLPYPVLVLREPALKYNLERMAAWCKSNGYLLAPHGKTTMSPQIYKRQIDLGAWGMTVACASQATVASRFGVSRILIANQLVGKSNIRAIVSAMNERPELEVYCLIDSVEGADHLARHAKEAGAKRPVRVFLESGRTGWRTGVRTIEEGRKVLTAIGRHESLLEFVGVEGFEGIAGLKDAPDVEKFLGDLRRLAEEVSTQAPEPKDGFLISIGGSGYLDYVHEFLQPLREKFRPIVRAGCTVTTDHGGYARQLQRARDRGKGEEIFPEFRPALELWSMVQSVRDGDTAILTFGKRDCPYDQDLPLPLFSVESGKSRKEARSLDGAKVVKTNDQHAYMKLAAGMKVQVGDRVACGIAHPCMAFDKWQVIPLIDANDKVIDLYCTYF